MIRFASLQFRIQAAVAFVALVVISIILGVTGPHLVHLYDSTVATCAAHNDCQSAITTFTNTDSALQILGNVLLIVVPALIGMFWGAPLVAREFETGTFRLAWTQGVTRTRWLVIKLAVVGLASMVVAGLLSVIVTWWSSPIDRVNMLGQVGNAELAGRFSSVIFGARNIAPVGYAAFAFVPAVAVGLMIRRTLPAMATALGGFVFARIALSLWVRPHLIAPLHEVIGLNVRSASSLTFNQTSTGIVVSADAVMHNAWIYSTQIVDTAGHAPTAAFLSRACPFNNTSGQPNYQTCIPNIAAKFHELVTYQPGSRYWAFQWYELAIYLALTAILAAVSAWWIRRRIS
ncbi:MAG: ABC transporter permease [Acidimicrobiales bacterium]|jgi:hypothetical protein